jgi:AAA15 family ATPase/GTPase
MINEIKIEKYNCFKNFQLTNLKQLNIITGENGVGKSTLLNYIDDCIIKKNLEDKWSNFKQHPIKYIKNNFQNCFELLFSFHNCKNTVLTIDEIENGIYYENMQIFWETLLSTSKEFNVQLFITTHSYEMLEYLQKAIENQTYWQEQLRSFRLWKHPTSSDINSYNHDYDYFSEIVKSKCEIR